MQGHGRKEDYIFDPLHWLALLEQKTNALDQAAPLVGWELPDVFATLRRLLEARMGKKGKREFCSGIATAGDLPDGGCGSRRQKCS